MTDHTNAELLTEAYDVLSRPIRADHESEEARGVIQRLAAALEAADQRAAEYAAVVEKVRHSVGDTVLYVPDEEDIDPDQESAYMEGAEHVKMRIRNTLATAPADTLRELKADVWDEGHHAGLRQADYEYGAAGFQVVKPNPYRREEKGRG